MYSASITCACGTEFGADATRNEMDSSFRCDCGASYLLTVTRLQVGCAN